MQDQHFEKLVEAKEDMLLFGQLFAKLLAANILSSPVPTRAKNQTEPETVRVSEQPTPSILCAQHLNRYLVFWLINGFL